jgi:hypothetical protein
VGELVDLVHEAHSLATGQLFDGILPLSAGHAPRSTLLALIEASTLSLHGVVPSSIRLMDRDQICARICARDPQGQAETEETEKALDDLPQRVREGQRDGQRQPETPEMRVVWLITQRRLATPRRAGTWPERGATASRKPASGALRGACSPAPIAWPAQITRRMAAVALIALVFPSLPFHDPFHEPGQRSCCGSLAVSTYKA